MSNTSNDLIKIVNDNLKIYYNDLKQREVEAASEKLNRIICVVSGFAAETFNNDFTFAIPFAAKGDIALSFRNKDGLLYCGFFQKSTQKVFLDTTLNVINKIDENTIDALLVRLHQNELYSNIHHAFKPTMHSKTIENAWNICLNSKQRPEPTVRSQISLNNNEMSVRQFYDISVSSPREEFACWILANDPTKEEKKAMASIVIDKICKELKEKGLFVPISNGLKNLQKRIDDIER